MTRTQLNYLSGFGSHWQTEALEHALPKGQNSPKKVPYGLYAEQLTGSAFTQPRAQNARSWLYRILPSVVQGDFEATSHHGFLTASQISSAPNQLRWNPMSAPSQPMNFIESWQAVAHNGNALEQAGGCLYLYAANQPMTDCYFYSSDGELIIVPYEGEMLIKTEFGVIELSPGEIACIPRGVKFQVENLTPTIKGYLCENFGARFTLPDLGPIGSNGLANPRDFLIPTAHFEEKTGAYTLYNKFGNRLWQAPIKHSPLNVVAWHGNYAPYKYDLSLFNTLNTVSFDHPDPSIFTVLTSGTPTPGVANIDFVIFPERWMVAEHTFRPPYYHRNVMSEYMGLIFGEYDAKSDAFSPGGGSLHNCMSAHGPDTQTFLKAQESQDKPEKLKDTLAFMFESSKPWLTTQWALETELREKNYVDCWQDLPKQFTSNQKENEV